jgi:hypothetical protein
MSHEYVEHRALKITVDKLLDVQYSSKFPRSIERAGVLKKNS